MMFVLSLALFVVAFFLYLISLLRIPSLRTYRLAQKISGPNKFWIIGIAFDLLNKDSKNILPYIKNELKKYPGPVGRVWILGIPLIFVVDPEFVKETLGKAINLKKGFEYKTLKNAIGNGLVGVDVPLWKLRRKLLAPLFNNKIVNGKLIQMNEHARILVDRLKEPCGKPVDVFSYLSLCVLQLLCARGRIKHFIESTMEVEVTDVPQLREFIHSFHEIATTLVDNILRMYLKDWMYEFTKMGKIRIFERKKLYNFTNRIIKERRSFLENNTEHGRKKPLFLDALLESDPKNKVYLTESDIRDEVTTFMLAGHDSTAVTTQFVLFHLGLDDEIQEKAYKEQHSIFGDSDRDVTENDIQEMTYLTQVIHESMRLYPPLPYISRELQEDTVCGGIVLPKGSNVVTSPYIIHRQEKLYPNPEKFDPERFSTEEVEKRHPYAYIPFGGGQRNCIAKNMAMANLKVILSTIIRKFKIIKDTELDEMELEIMIFLSASKPIMMKFLQRD